MRGIERNAVMIDHDRPPVSGNPRTGALSMLHDISARLARVKQLEAEVARLERILANYSDALANQTG